MPVFALTIFLGAFLLFQVQPLIGKYILPWFGGGSGVWTTCMLFFQVVLLGGYAYAHFSSRFLKLRTQGIVHLTLLAVALALLPIIPGDSWKPRGGTNPTLQILAMLLATLGLPYLVLSATSPLLQQWFSRSKPGASPYRLFALSNAGSLLALISYPLFFETHFTRKAQATVWQWGLAAYAIGCAFCAWRVWWGKRQEGEKGGKGLILLALPLPGGEGERSSDPRLSSLNVQPSTFNQLLWLLLPGCASVLLLAVTNKLCQDVAVIPFLWVLPLGLYLLSFIICFDSPRWYARLPFALALIAAITGFCWALFKGGDASIKKQVAIYCGGLFVCCMVCHGELYQLRPDPRHLTRFYLMIAAGGALGGLFVAVAAPLVFTDYYELQWGIALCGLLFTLICMVERPVQELDNEAGKADSVGKEIQSLLTSAATGQWRTLACALTIGVFAGIDWSLVAVGGHYKAAAANLISGLRVTNWSLLALLTGSWIVRGQFRKFRHWRMLACAWLSLGLLVLGGALWKQAHRWRKETAYASRNFYGVLKIYEYNRESAQEHYLLLQHGRITHGLQFTYAEKAAWPTTYYGEESGIGVAVRALPVGRRRFGLVGLGAGTIAAYGRAGDYLRIYEINPEVQRLATSRFTFLTHCAGRIEVVPGDARLSMEREPPQAFDLLALDAFSSDSIPVHLLTREAFELYDRHLKTNGIIAVHISNHFLDLEPVVQNIASERKYKLALIDYDATDDEEEGRSWLYPCTWMLLARSEEVINSPVIRAVTSAVKTNAVKVPLWTDDFASLFQILK